MTFCMPKSNIISKTKQFEDTLHYYLFQHFSYSQSDHITLSQNNTNSNNSNKNCLISIEVCCGIQTNNKHKCNNNEDTVTQRHNDQELVISCLHLTLGF